MPAYEIAEVLPDEPKRHDSQQYGPTFYFKVKLTDGTEAECGKKKLETPPKVGDQYEVLRPSSKAGYLPTLQKPLQDRPGGGKSYEADPKKLRSENARSALHVAKDLAIAQMIELDQMSAWARRIYDFIEEKAQ